MKKSGRWLTRALAALLLGAAALLAGGAEAKSGPAEPAWKAITAAEPVETLGGEEELLPLAEEPPESAGDLETLRELELPGVPEAYRDAAGYAVLRELLVPGETGDLNGEEPVCRGEAVRALYRLSGILVRVDACPYADVPEAYQDAVAWAAAVGVSGGVSEERFAPLEPVTRSQLAVMLRRFAAWRGEDTESRTAVSFPGEEVPAYAEEAVNWVMDRGLYEGMTDHGLYPALPVSRLQLAAVLARLERDRDPLAAELTLPGGETASLSRQHHEEIQAAVDRVSRSHGAVGVQVAVVEGGAVTDTYEYGWAVKGTVPMTNQHKMRVASLSKVAVSLSAALLREEGAVDLDEDIGTYWGKNARNPRYPDIPITARTILTHTSTLLNSESIAWEYSGVRAQLGAAKGYGSGVPGSLKSWSYNNHAFGILGQTLELASGELLDGVLARRVLGPVGADGGFAAGDLRHPELVTPLYRTNGLGRSAENQRLVRRWESPGATGRQFAGGFTSSARDMAKIVALLAGDGCFEGVRLMEAASVAEMERYEDQALPGGFYQALALRKRFDLYGRESLYYHTGSAYGVYNLLSYDPASGDGVVVLTMGADGGMDRYGVYAVCGEISRAVYDAIR